MKKYIPFLGFLFLLQTGFAQNPNLDSKYAVKLYNLTTYEDYSNSGNDTNVNAFRYSNENLRIFHPTFAFQWKTMCNNFQEVELTDFSFGITGHDASDTTGIEDQGNDKKFTTAYVSARYEYILNFNKKKDTKFVPSLGFGINPYYWHYTDSPEASNAYWNAENIFGARYFLTPRLTYYFSNKFFIDLNIPICLFDTYFESYKSEDPTLPIEEQRTSSFTLEAFPKVFSGRIGVGLKF
jgi:hypothetical protein